MSGDLARAKRNDELGDLEAQELQHRPWWRWAMPWMPAGPRLERGQSRMVGVLGAANLVDNYDIAILGLALPQIQAALAVPEGQLGGLSAVIRLGVIPAVVLSALADGVGRRRLLLVTILGFTVLTGLTSLAQTKEQFMLLQFLARVFIAAEGILAVVVIAEELNARTRGWGIGVLGALGALGHGVAAVIFALVNVLPFGWRSMYLLGIAPLLMLAWFRRTLRETKRFEEHRRARAHAYDLREALRPFRSLLVMYPGRLLAMCAALIPVAFVFETSGFFASKMLQSVHGYSPAQVTLLYLTAGIAAPIGNIVAGALGDRFGRKRIMILGILGNAASVYTFYNASGGVWVPIGWSLGIFFATLVTVLFAALGAELFPTSYRSTASGVRAVIATGAAAVGLVIEGALYNLYGSHNAAITAMLVVTPIGPIVGWIFLPETASRELEEISPEVEGA